MDVSRKVYDIIENLGHTHTSNFVKEINPVSFYEADEKTWEKRYYERLSQIEDAEVCVFETSIPSLATGQLFQEAVRQEKPTIALYKAGKYPHTLMGVEANEKRVQVVEYSNDNLTEVVRYSLDEAESQLNTRFTMLLPPELVKYLDTVKFESGLSRSEYIRNLLKQDMEKRG